MSGSRLMTRKEEHGRKMIDESVIHLPRLEVWKKPENATRLLDHLVKDIEHILNDDLVRSRGQGYRRISTRRVGFFGLTKESAKSYYYAGAHHVGQLTPPKVRDLLWELQSWMRPKYAEIGVGYATNFHVNRYKPEGFLGLHADDQESMDQNAAIVSLSLGATRKFQVCTWVVENDDLTIGSLPVRDVEFWDVHRAQNDKHRKAVRIDKVYELRHGDVIIMKPGCQKWCKHALLEARGDDKKALHNDILNKGVRYNVTLRKFE